MKNITEDVTEFKAMTIKVPSQNKDKWANMLSLNGTYESGVSSASNFAQTAIMDILNKGL